MARKRRRRRSRESTRAVQDQVVLDPDVPIHDFFECIDLDKPWGLGEALSNLRYCFETGYFLQWEAIVRQEQGLRLTRAQKGALSGLVSFGDETDDRVLYIDEIARPSEPWYEIVREIAPRLLQEPFRTYKVYDETVIEGWPGLVENLEKYGQDLSLPEGVTSPLDVIPADLRHRLWLQTCFDALGGLGQDKELTLEDERQQVRVGWFIDLLREHKDTVEHFDLTLETLLTRVILLPKDAEIFVKMMMDQLGFTSPQDRLADFL
jgi:hypothetical protein